ncbi:nitroreductase family protein [bacterium]|nr:MAG: nitroreductase family protein [bacterium]
MEFSETVKARVSIREYSQRLVSKELLEKLVDAGRMAPSARAVEPWSFIVVRDKKTIEMIAGIAPNGAFIRYAQAAIIVVSEDTKYYIEDCSAATENILLQAVDLGLGACWIAGDKKPYADDVMKMLNCPAGTRLASIISVGYPLKARAQKKSKCLSDIIHWESF